VTSALIGYTGFVGANLARTEHFELLVNRANIESLQGARLERLVCAGLPAAKWIANQRPQEDADNVCRLEAVLTKVQSKRFVLISTIDVYPGVAGADETYDCSREPSHAYGKHRLEFEHFVRKMFPHAHIVRLPALFGRGLKKNAIYDLLHDNRLESINPASRFQWYPLARLPQDLRTIEAHGLSLVNLFTEPLETRTILQQLFADKTAGNSPDPPAYYDLRTRHGAIFGGDSRYVMSGAEVMTALGEFIRAERMLL
jgi:RmlD substrate binding domain